MLILFFFLTSFYCRPGTIAGGEHQLRYTLVCPDKEDKKTECYFDFELPSDYYTYISYDKIDTTIFIVQSSEDMMILKTTGGFMKIK